MHSYSVFSHVTAFAHYYSSKIVSLRYISSLPHLLVFIRALAFHSPLYAVAVHVHKHCIYSRSCN